MLQELSETTENEKLSVLFETLDKDRDGKLCKQELAAGIVRIRGDACFKEKAEAASELVTAFATNEDGYLNLSEFEILFQTLLPAKY